MSNAVDYWEMTEKARSALTREQVAKFIDFELMRKGVLALEPLTLVAVPAPKLETTAYYRIRAGSYNRIDLAFTAEAGARAVLEAMPLLVTSEYVGETIACASADEFSIECVELPTKATVEAAKLTLKEAAEAKAENERRTKAHAEQGKAVESATKGLWFDWHECVAKAACMAKVEATFTKYIGLAGNEETAMKFLRTVFTIEELHAAEAWTGRDLGSSRSFDAPEAHPMPGGDVDLPEEAPAF